jgi:hypothetical protein
MRERNVDVFGDFYGEIGLVCRLLIDAVYKYLYGKGEEKEIAEKWIFSSDQSAENSFDNLLNLLIIDINPDAAREALKKNIPDRKPFIDKRSSGRRWNFGNESANSSKRRRGTRTNICARNDRYIECCETIDWIKHIIDQSISERSIQFCEE